MACITNNPRLNVVDDANAVIRRQQEEIKMLTEELRMRDILAQRGPAQYAPFTHGQKAEVHAQVEKYLSGELTKLPVTNVRQVHEVYREFKAVVTRLKTSDAGARSGGGGAAAATAAGGAEVTAAAVDGGGTSGKVGAVGDLGSTGFSVGPVDDGKSAAPRSKQSSRAGHSGSASVHGGNHDAEHEIRRKLILVVEETSTPRSIFNETEKKTRIAVKDVQKIVADAGFAKKVLGAGGSGADAAAAAAAAAEGGAAVKDVVTQLEEWKEAQVTVEDFLAMLPPATVKKDYHRLTRDEAFEEYQRNLGGKELAAVLMENKQELKKKQAESRVIAIAINGYKVDIDRLASEMAHMESFYPAPKEGETRVMDEPVFQRLNESNALKTKYRTEFRLHQTKQAEIAMLEKLIGQCREKLLLEFAQWFADVGSEVANAELQAEMDAINSAAAGKMVRTHAKPGGGGGGGGGGERKTGTALFRQQSKIALRFMNPISAQSDEQQRAYDMAKNATIRRTQNPERRRRLSTVAARSSSVSGPDHPAVNPYGGPIPGIRS